MITKSFKKVGLTVRISDDELSYDDAVKQCPEGWRLIKLSEAMRIIEMYKDALPFWFWCKNPEWNKMDWRPVGRGSNGRFDLSSGSSHWASRGVYVKEVTSEIVGILRKMLNIVVITKSHFNTPRGHEASVPTEDDRVELPSVGTNNDEVQK